MTKHRADIPTAFDVALSAHAHRQAVIDDFDIFDHWDEATAAGLRDAHIAQTGPREVTIRVARADVARAVGAFATAHPSVVDSHAAQVATMIADGAGAPFETAHNASDGRGTIVLTW